MQTIISLILMTDPWKLLKRTHDRHENIEITSNERVYFLIQRCKLYLYVYSFCRMLPAQVFMVQLQLQQQLERLVQ
jgi:hypothetical protein